MIFSRQHKFSKILATILLLSAVIVATRAEQFPGSYTRPDYFQKFQDVGAFAHQRQSPEYSKLISQISGVLTNQPFLGVDTSLDVQASGTSQNKENIKLSRGKRAAEDSNFNNDTATENISFLIAGNVTSSSSDLTDSGVTSGGDGLLATSRDLSNDTNLETTSRDLSNDTNLETTSRDLSNDTNLETTERASSSFPRTSQGIPTSTPAPTSQCLEDTQRVFSSVGNGEQWGLAFLDSWGKPGPGLLKGQFKFVGAYRECLESKSPTSNETGSAGFRGNYCAVGLSFQSSSAVSPLTALGSAIEIGACMPSSCSAQEVFGLVIQGLTSANLSSQLAVTNVDCRNDEREYTAASIVSIIFLSIIGLLMILGTAYDILFVQWPKWVESNDSDDEEYLPANEKTNGYHPIGDRDTNEEARIPLDEEKHVITNGASAYPGGKNGAFSEGRPLLGKGQKESQGKSGCHGVFSKVLMAFSVYTNGKKMLNTSQPAGSLGAIHGIRFLSMSWVILGHVLLFSIYKLANLGTAMSILLNRWTFDAISNALVSVDTFFALSGLLTGYLTFKEIQKKGWKLNWAMYYFHRFWRLTPPYMLVLVTALGLHRFFGSGAMWSSSQPLDKTFCENNWWTNLLYVNNFFKTRQMCMAHSWYLANDMQFHILSPLLIVPFYFNVYAGLGSCLVFLLASWTTAGVLSTNNEWPSTLMQAYYIKEGTLDYQHFYYYAPYCRIGPFVIGILSGYFLAVTKGRLNMKWYYAILGWAVAIAVGLASVYGIHGDVTGANPSSVGVVAFYNTMARTAWGACVCWVIVACASGYGGPVNALLSWSPFVCLGRLTYMSYLIHPTIIYAYFDNMDTRFYLNDTNFVISYLGILVFTNMVSFVLVLAFESPMIGLEKVFLRH